MIIGAYYIERSHRHVPCWTVANTAKEAVNKAKAWAVESNCYVAVCAHEKGKYKQLVLFDEKGKEI